MALGALRLRALLFVEYKFKPKDQVKLPGFGRPGTVLMGRDEERHFKKRGDVGERRKLSQPHYIVQLPNSSSTRFYPEAQLTAWEA